MTPKAPPAVVAELAPTGKLRAVINLGNPVLAGKDARTAGARYLAAFVEDMKASGFVRALARHCIEGAAVAPAARGS
jgi:hypothetical protein